MRIVWLLLACTLIAAAGDRDEKDHVVSAVNQLFTAMSAKDAPAMAAIMTDDAKLFAAQDDKISPPRTRDDFAQRIASNKSHIVERIWKPTVLVRGRIAMLWAEYDLHVDGKFGHCGIDAFMLLKTDAGWKISNIEYTSETQNCKPSPLGPLKEKQ